MNNLKYFNESISGEGKIWAVIITSEDAMGQIGCGDYSMCFVDKLKAADYLIKYINKLIEQNVEDMDFFEPFFENGSRLFLTVEENPDFNKAMEFLESKLGDWLLTIELVELEISNDSNIIEDVFIKNSK